MIRILFNSSIVVLLTLLTQVGGLVWIFALFFKRKMFAFALAYALTTTSAVWVAPYFGRVAISCFDRGPLEVQSWMYCALNRNYVSPELADVLKDTAQTVNARFPGTKTLLLDANFPFFDGFPLLPHLSHDDGVKADLAFFYRNEEGYLSGATRSPIGYFAFEDGSSNCANSWPTMRWNLRSLQTFGTVTA